MGLLRTADRSSLVSEVRQLRAQLLHLSEAQPSERKEGGGGADGAAAPAAAAAAVGPSDRLLAEELKVELSQTKLELETTLKAQHKHLKELDALRCDWELTRCCYSRSQCENRKLVLTCNLFLLRPQSGGVAEGG